MSKLDLILTRVIAVAVLPFVVFGARSIGQVEMPELGDLRMNEIQVIGTHNSFKKLPEAQYLAGMRAFYADADEIDYGHLPLRDQLALGVRNLELDVYYDPEGGRYAEPLGLRMMAMRGGDPMPFDPEGELDTPGLKVLHEADFDFRTHHYTLEDALAAVRAWSEANRDHVPVMVTMNLKEGKLPLPGAVEAVPFDAAALDMLDRVISEGLGEDLLLTPDRLRGEQGSVRDAIARDAGGAWPTVDDVRGRFYFVVEMNERMRGEYLRPEEGRPPLDGRVTFPASRSLDDPWAAFFVMNSPPSDEVRIRSAVAAGFIVRTRADSNTAEMRAGDYRRFAAAKRSGAQVITTDYPVPDLRHNPEFSIRFSSEESEHPFIRRRPEVGF